MQGFNVCKNEFLEAMQCDSFKVHFTNPYKIVNEFYKIDLSQTND